jgi:hypothetical protein
MGTGPNRSYWIATGLERLQPALNWHRPGETLHRVASVGIAASWGWMIVAAIVVVTRLGALAPGPWESVRLAALVVGPGAAGIALSLGLEMLARRRRRRGASFQ